MGWGYIVSICAQKNYVACLNLSFVVVSCCFLILHFNSAEFTVLRNYSPRSGGSDENHCNGLKLLDDYKSKCLYLKSSGSCVSEGYIDYLSSLYCNFARFPLLGLCLLFFWLLVLFYLLGTTASDYFCSSLESLSRLLRLSPTIAGVTLLSLGNGAPDVFASLVSFMGNGTSDVGFNTLLGGASSVTCLVVGIISIFLHKKHVQVDKSAFLRDVCFFLLILASLAVILVQGKIDLWGAFGFASMYIVYVFVVYLLHIWGTTGERSSERDANSSYGNGLIEPMLNVLEKGDLNCYTEPLDSDTAEAEKHCCFCVRSSASCTMLLYILELPLQLPRRLTIPLVSERNWSKPIAVASVTLAPILLSALWSSQDDSVNLNPSLAVYGIGFLLGITSGILAFLTTDKSSPPRKCLLPWLAGGFLMSMIWSYIIAQELVALLVSLGYVFGISPSILGLTVLAWGNSLGDLITNLTMALKGGPEGVQVAISGCYAGPIFNTLFGLGLSLVGSSWYAYPSSFMMPKDPYLLETLGFLIAGLLCALVVLPMRDMKLDSFLGGSLVAVYLISLTLRLTQTVGSDQVHHVYT